VTVVLDADVVIGALDAADAHHGEARERFLAWRSEGTIRLLGLVNLTEVLIGPSAEPTLLHRAREAIAALGIVIHVPTEVTGVEAARLRRRHPISLPDAYALATARQVGGTLATFDGTLLSAASHEGLT
jgi:predicted nucleic acid-binding protein